MNNKKHTTENTVLVNNRKYPYSLTKVNKNVTFIKCDGANIAQEFLNEDVPNLLIDLPYMILAEKQYQKKQDLVIRFRVTVEDKKNIEKKAREKGYQNVSSFIRDTALNS